MTDDADRLTTKLIEIQQEHDDDDVLEGQRRIDAEDALAAKEKRDREDAEREAQESIDGYRAEVLAIEVGMERNRRFAKIVQAFWTEFLAYDFDTLEPVHTWDRFARIGRQRADSRQLGLLAIRMLSNAGEGGDPLMGERHTPECGAELSQRGSCICPPEVFSS